MEQTSQDNLENPGKYLDSMTFASLSPVLYLVLLAGVYAAVADAKVLTVYLITAWSVAALSILRIQQLIEHYSAGRYPYQPGACAVLLMTVVLVPWAWLYFLCFLFRCLDSWQIAGLSHTSWVCAFTLGATTISLVAVSPMIESWYELLRGSCGFDGSRIKPPQPSLWAQIWLFLLFAGILLLPMVVANSHPAYNLERSDANYMLTGFFSTYVALCWLVERLESIREAQLSIHNSPRAPVDRTLLKRSSPLSSMLGPSHRSRSFSSVPRRRKITCNQIPSVNPAPVKNQSGSIRSSLDPSHSRC